MESPSLMLVVILMVVTPIWVLLYVALVIAIPVCRLLDWLRRSPPSEQEVPKRLM